MTGNLRQFPAILRFLAVAALIVRAMVPSGWMPVADADGIRIAICSGSGPMEMVIDRNGGLHEGSPPADRAAPRDPCPFGLASAMAADVPAPMALPAPPIALPEEHARAVSFAARPFARAVKPPARGPPATA
ncbi:MAG: hypothetical protein ACKOPO_12455 [Novosphingobium sp.]